MRVMVTGSAGMIGRGVVEVLEARGHEVVGYDLVDGLDVLYVHTLENAMRACEVVVHLAAISYPWEGMGWADYWRSNCQAVVNVATVAEKMGVRRLVFTSSTLYYGAERGMAQFWRGERWPVDEDSPNAVQFLKAGNMVPPQRAALFYMVSKVVAEAALAAWGLAGTLEVAVLRLCPVSEQGAAYAWGLRVRTERVVEAIVQVVEGRRAMGYEVFNIAEADVEAVSTRKWEGWFGGRQVGK